MSNCQCVIALNAETYSNMTIIAAVVTAILTIISIVVIFVLRAILLNVGKNFRRVNSIKMKKTMYPPKVAANPMAFARIVSFNHLTSFVRVSIY